MKKVLSIVLCAVVCIAMLPAGAFAAGQVSAPKHIAATSSGTCKIRVYWDKVPGADGYKVYSKKGKNGKYTLRKTTSSTSCKLNAYYYNGTDKHNVYYYKVKAYKKVKGKLRFSSYSKVASAETGAKNWNVEKLEKDIVEWLSSKGYTVKLVSMGDIYGSGEGDWYSCHSPETGGNYDEEYSKILKKVKKDILEIIDDAEDYYKENTTDYSINAIRIEVKDSVNSYGVSLDGAEVYVVVDTTCNYPDLDEATKQKYIQRIFELVNQERAKAGVAPLTLNQKLCDMAAFKLNEMDELHYYGHKSPVYGTPSEMAKAFGITDRGCGENLAGVSTPDEAMEGWLSSEGHRANILNPRYTQIGIGVHISSDYGTKTFIQQFIY